MRNFKPNDKVVCISNLNKEGILFKGEIYIVESIYQSSFIYIKEFQYDLFAKRFIKASKLAQKIYKL